MDEAPPLAFIGNNEVLHQGRQLLYFSGCDYFRLARSPKLKAATIAALEQNGLNVAASRATTGNHKIYARLEQELAVFFGADTAVLLPDGYFAPLAAAQALAREFTHAFTDEFAHGALLDAARQLHCPLKSFPHRDAAGLKKLLVRAGSRARPLILTDGMFAHDGSIAPLQEYLNLLPAAGRILVDDAHGAGVLGANGPGHARGGGGRAPANHPVRDAEQSIRRLRRRGAGIARTPAENHCPQPGIHGHNPPAAAAGRCGTRGAAHPFQRHALASKTIRQSELRARSITRGGLGDCRNTGPDHPSGADGGFKG